MSAVTLLLAAVLAAATPATPEPEGHAPRNDGSLALSPASGPVRIPFDLRGNHVYLRGRVNDSDSLWMVLDTGASGNVIDAGVAKGLGLEVASIGRGRGAGGTVESGHIREVTLKLPGATLAGSPIAAMPLHPFQRQTGRAMEAIIGHPFFDRCVVKVDYVARVLEVLPAASFEYTGKGVVLPLTFEHRLPYVEARVTLPGRKPIEGRFVVDLGSSQALILSPKFIREERVNDAITKTIEARGRGVGGQMPTRVGRVERFEIGGIAFDRPVTGLPVAADARVGAPQHLGNFGGEFLRRFTVIFDYSRKRMILEPNARLGDPFEADMSGIAPRMGPDGSGTLEVEWIQTVSPAAEAGVRPNDLIESIDGRPALEVGVPGLREMFRREGNTHRLTIRRGDERIEVALTTRRLI
jgi:aspartyl protease/PDZ domain-containing protein